MRWQKESHAIGEIRYKKLFALLPQTIGKTTIWLEFYYVKQVWSPKYSQYSCSVIGEEWDDVKSVLADDINLSPLNKALE